MISDALQNIIITFGCLAGLFFLWLAVHNSRSWERFIYQHHCKVVAKKSGQYVIGFGKGSGQWIPGTTTWRCDDDTEYTK